jgi:predicted lipid-binding transport protein (Tim44 family)
MSRGYPSMTALLGLLAIAGYQNRDKIAEMLRGAQSNPADPAASTKAGARGATPGNLGGILGGASIGHMRSFIGRG